MERTYKNVGLFFIFILLVVVWGFYRTYFGLFPNFTGITTLQHFHGAMLLSWFALLIIQPFLIRYHKYELHKQLGKISFLLIPLVLISIFLVTKTQYNRMASIVTREQNIGSLALNLPDIFAFGGLYILAMLHKKNTPYHMRYMIATSLLMLGPGTGRAFIIYGNVPFAQGVEYSMLLAEILTILLIVYDVKKGNTYKPYLVTMGILIALHIIWHFQLSGWWQAFGGKFASLFF